MEKKRGYGQSRDIARRALVLSSTVRNFDLNYLSATSPPPPHCRHNKFFFLSESPQTFVYIKLYTSKRRRKDRRKAGAYFSDVNSDGSHAMEFRLDVTRFSASSSHKQYEKKSCRVRTKNRVQCQ